VLEAVDGIAAVSESIKHRIAALGISPSKIGVLGAAVDKAVFVPGSRQEARQQLRIAGTAEVLVWVGRMVAVKALDVLLDVVGAPETSRPNLRSIWLETGRCGARWNRGLPQRASRLKSSSSAASRIATWRRITAQRI
jgi:hypothetical protein